MNPSNPSSNTKSASEQSHVRTPSSWRSSLKDPFSIQGSFHGSSSSSPVSNGNLLSSPAVDDSPAASNPRLNVRNRFDGQSIPGPTSKKNTKACLRLASENMRGRGAQNILNSVKWHKLSDYVRKDKIGLLCVQETHINEEHVSQLEGQYEHLHIINSELPGNPTGAGGVAVVLNKLLTNSADVQSFEIVPGRALVVSLNWHRGDRLTVLGVYAPTDRKENNTFWDTVKSSLKRKRRQFPRPDIMLGDFNCVEDPIDRFPAKLSRIDAPASLDSLKKYLKVRDGWRLTNPGALEWSWRNENRSSMSRIDRIYMSKELLQTSREWRISISSLNANDHSRISVEIVNLDSPEVGKGRWTMRDLVTNDAKFIAKASERGLEALKEMKLRSGANRTDLLNAQTIWKAFKDDVVKLAKTRSTEIIARRDASLNAKVAERRAKIAALAAAQDEEERLSRKRELRQLENEIFKQKDEALEKTFFNRRIKACLEAETMSKSWFGWTKDNRTRDTMFTMRKPGREPAEYVTATKAMAEVARDYHEELQLADLEPGAEDRDEAIRSVLQHLELPLSVKEKQDLDCKTSSAEIAETIRLAPNSSAAGIDGITYEFWKALNSLLKKSRRDKVATFDCSVALQMVFEDMEMHGVSAECGFADGWMCPLYKKGERSEISNYRPITLLNTDYKIYTKILAIRLAVIAPRLIHSSQAGFVRGRSITDHIKMTNLMLNYAETREEDGMIVALDQEKAYDRIRHDYLRSCLRTLNFPAKFVKMIDSLYENAYTRVMINGHLSTSFRVTRGVRQGDPLSCLLFNLAIEPLSAMLRNSTLQGYKIEGITEKLIATLYADDTTVYLSKDDDFGLLQRILNEWCKASGAKFNTLKTEIIPLGSIPFRELFIESRKVKADAMRIPDEIRIAREGEPTRILGAWPGNKVGTANAWSVIVDRIQLELAKWERKRPTLNGKSIISRVIVGGRTQFLTAAQGMPQGIEKKIDKLVLDFFWGGSKRHPVNMATLRGEVYDGGLKLFHAGARNDAQYLVWLGSFLAPDELRPTWAYIADQILRHAVICKDKNKIPRNARANPFSQDWRPNLRKLPFELKQMVKTAWKYELMLEDPYIPTQIRENMQIWCHPAVKVSGATRREDTVLRCLKVHHAVNTLEDLDEIAELDNPEHLDSSDCACENCEADREEGCIHPHKCQAMANDILSTVPPKWSLSANTPTVSVLSEHLECANAQLLAEGEALLFDKSYNESRVEADLYRILGSKLAIEGVLPHVRMREAETGVPEFEPFDPIPVQAIVCASMIRDNNDSAQGGFGVSFADGEEDNEEIFHRCSGSIQSHTVSSLHGIRAAAEFAPRNQTLHVISTSKSAVTALSTRLGAHESAGWTDVPDIAQAGRAAAAALRSRNAETTLMYIQKDRFKDWPDVRILNEMTIGAPIAGDFFADTNLALAPFDRPGLSIRGITQRKAHRAIREAGRVDSVMRRRTAANIALVKAAVGAECMNTPTTKQIWISLTDKALSRSVRNFLWKGVHGAHKVGEYFHDMPEPWKGFEMCPSCDKIESMEHILFECSDSGQEKIWELCQDFLATKLVNLNLNIGMVWGCASAQIEWMGGGRSKGIERCFRVIVSESAFLAWKLRCEKRFEHADEPEWRLSDEEVSSRWQKMKDARIKQDVAMTNKYRYGKRAIDRFLISRTWEDPRNPRAFWANNFNIPGVLVGEGEAVSRGIG